MKTKMIAAILGLTLLNSSMAFAADSTHPSRLSAFKNVNTETVSVNEMNDTSGEFFPIVVYVGAVAAGAAIGAAAVVGQIVYEKVKSSVNIAP